MDISVEKLLTSTDNLQLTTKGRRTGKPHSITVSFAYDDGYVYLLTGVPRDWHKNIKKDPKVTLRICDSIIHGIVEPIFNEEKTLAEIKSMFKKKYSSNYYVKWYERVERIPVRIKLASLSNYQYWTRSSVGDSITNASQEELFDAT